MFPVPSLSPYVASWEEERTASLPRMWLDSNVVDVVWPKIQFLSPGSVSAATLRINCLSSGCGAGGCSTITSPPFRLERNNTQRKWSHKLSCFCLLQLVFVYLKKKKKRNQILSRCFFLLLGYVFHHLSLMLSDSMHCCAVYTLWSACI